ncbi:MAG TPA: efflux RND transporter periplasmic adaptor subunit [Gemmataceae bacterium]|nr:efflux RND transporter periplasmic adaptor subunit [Gemmataceae bacterium]
MSKTNDPRRATNSEGGLHAPPDFTFWQKVWWWFDFLILVNLARLRFIAILAAIGFVIVTWPTLTAYYERWTRPADHDHAAGSDFEFFCPMHPTVIRDNPKEKCPICFMPLSKRKKGDGTVEALPPGIANRVQLSPYRVVLAGIKTWKVDYVPLSKEITTVGYVEFNEREMKQVAARVKGRIDKLYVNETGEMVHANDVLASLYSPDLQVTVQNLIDAKSSGNASLMNIARDRLKLWGISDDQILEIEKTGKANSHLKIRSPIKGHVIKKYVKEGQYVEEGMPLYDVVDLSTVWIQAQVYEDDMAFLPYYHRPLKRAVALKDGMPVTATTQANPGQTFEGRLTFVYPHVDQDTRSVTIRFELDNPEHKLRPGSSATVKLKVPAQQLELLAKNIDRNGLQEAAGVALVQSFWSPLPLPGIGWVPPLNTAARQTALRLGLVLAVPEGAVIDTGKQQIVYREIGACEYEGVLVELGPRMTDAKGVIFYPVLRGIQAGDVVVTGGSFLLDAETRLNPAAGSIYFGGSGSKSSQSGGTIKPSTPDDQEAKIIVALAKLSDADRQLAEAQRFCPILEGSRLGSMNTPVKVLLDNQVVFLCCRGCLKKAQDQPQETLEKVQKLKAKTISTSK